MDRVLMAIATMNECLADCGDCPLFEPCQLLEDSEIQCPLQTLKKFKKRMEEIDK